LTVSDYFPANHPKRGEKTGFEYKIKNGIKIHTIRANYDFWKKRIDVINDGLAILSIRRWTGKPYRSKQEEIVNLDKVGIQKLDTGQPLNSNLYAEGDGLSVEDFRSWFLNYDFDKPMAIIHFTEFRY
jgi:hypothetical protein